MKAALPEPESVTRKGKPVSAILPIKDYEELLERVEDAEDVTSLKRARRKPLHYRPLEEYTFKLELPAHSQCIHSGQTAKIG